MGRVELDSVIPSHPDFKGVALTWLLAQTAVVRCKRDLTMGFWTEGAAAGVAQRV